MYIYWLRSVEDETKVIDFYGDHLYELGSKVFAFNEWWIVEDFAPDKNIAAWEDDDFALEDFYFDAAEYAAAWRDE